MQKESEKLSAVNLKSRLWDCLNDLKDGNADVTMVMAVASGCREIIRCVNTQLKIAHQTSRPVPADVTGFSENVNG